MTLDEFLSRFNRVRKSGSGYSAQCPAHDDKKNSLSITTAEEKYLINCHVGCPTESILSAVGLNMSDLFTSNDHGGSQDHDHRAPVVARYPYHDARGALLYTICRTATKGFFPERTEDGALVYNLKGVRRVLYNLPAVIKSKLVHVVEGEKDVEALRAIGFVATTNCGGAEGWRDDYAESFKNKFAVIFPDNDKPGRRRAWRIARSIVSFAKAVKLIELPSLPEKGDVSDFLKEHTKEELLKIIKDAKPLTVEEVNSHKEEKTDEWPEPRPIQAQLYPVPAFDPEILLPEALRAWVIDEAERMPCPPDFIAAAAIVGAGAVIGARCTVKPKAKDDWLIVPNVWGGNVGIPSEKKSPAQISATRPIDKLIVLAKEDHKAKLIDFDAKNVIFVAEKEALEYTIKSKAREKYSKNKEGKTSFGSIGSTMERLAEQLRAHQEQTPKEPIERRYKTNDTTVEKLGELLRDNPTGMLVLRDELVGLLSSWDREGREGDRAFFLEAWNGNASFDTDRIGRGSIFIPNLCVSIFGGIQPDKLTIYLEQAAHALANDGMLQRFQVLVYPNHMQWEWRDSSPKKEARETVFEVFKELADLVPTDWGAAPASDFIKSPYFRFDDDAQKIFIEWSADLHNQRIAGEDNPLIAQHLTKYDKLFPALALIFHLIDCALDPKLRGPVTELAAIRASAWCQYLEQHARRCYGLLVDDGLRSAQALAAKLQDGKLEDGFTARDVRRNQWRYLTTDESVQAALDWLIDEGWLRAEVVGSGGKTGRPTVRHLINPRLKKAGES